MRVPQQIVQFAQRFPTDSNIWIVGGAVRDHFRGVEPADFDMVCFGMDMAGFETVIAGMNFKRTIGKAIGNGRFTQPPVFAVEIAPDFWVDVAMARIDVSTGAGMHDVEFEVGAHITKEQDAERRDFTTGCIFFNPITQEVFDPFNGVADIQAGIIRHCSDHFSESPERPWRFVAQVARFDFVANPDTIEVCKTVDMSNVPTEQVWRHFEKMITGGRNIQRGVDVAHEIGIMPEMSNIPQSNDPVVVMASMFNQMDDGQVFMESVGFPHKMRSAVVAVATTERGRKNARQMAHIMGKSGANIRQWAIVHNDPQIVAEAEFWGVADNPERPIVTGDVMIAMGFKPGKEMGNIMKAAFEAQMVGAFDNVVDGMEWVQRHQ